MRFVSAREFTADRAWGAPYVWHVNDGTEVFAVLDGAVARAASPIGGVRLS